ncbi:SIR2 family protein [Chromobacterium sphagni]|uniref:SIR2 family protein n=1 Tax=Chromobacterium sphagni TaxID=1903179 RepID=UPI0009F4DDEF|nr:SIR2 family protein [Chromobacterium sphagni]
MASNIPAPIKSAIESGHAILFLGAGASYDALLSGKPTRIYADTVRDTLSDKFLGGAHKKLSLMAVADFARSEASLNKVQQCIRDLFLNLNPADFHLKIPTFRWKAIVSTNYDLVIERAYSQCPERLQELMPVTRDGDDLEVALSAQNTVPYLKLHGCINNYNEPNTTIVLDSNEYAKFKKGRENLVKTFTEWAMQSPIIFCGYSLSDENIKEILFDIGDASQNRDQYLYVDIAFDEIQTRYWLQRRIVPFQNTFAGFLTHIDGEIPKANRKLASLFSNKSLSISKWIPSHAKPSDALAQYLNEELIHVLPTKSSTNSTNAKDFYCGLDISFGPIYAGFDVRRAITDTILERAVLDTIASTKPKLFLIKGYAGAGKSVLAKRIAIEASDLLDTPLVISLREGAILRNKLLIELQQLVQDRLFVFVDDIVEHSDSFRILIESIFNSDIPITIVACIRTNELNIYGRALQNRVTRDFELQDLERNEALQLLDKLATARVLGNLEQYSLSDRELFIQKFYDHQLLVALHELTYGGTFEQIIVNEFENILPREAQQLYLDICTLHQCGVGVRAGLLSRITGYPIVELDRMLNGPLSRVIRSNYDRRYRDNVYSSRHSEIARMVFSLAIKDPKMRAHQLVRMLSKIDLDYSSDKKAFFELIRGKKLAEMFDKKELALEVFAAAQETSAPQGFIAHQRAILELNHPTGHLDIALEYLREAERHNQDSGYRDASLQHTKANLLRKKALSAKTQLERERYRGEARGILKAQIGRRDNSYPEHLYGQILLDEIKDYFSKNQHASGQDNNSSRESNEPIVRVINELTYLIDESLKRSPGDGPLTLLRSEFLRRIGEHPRALLVLESFHKDNPNNTSISRVLAEALSTSSDLERGIEILKSTILLAPGDTGVNLVLAKLLMWQDEQKNATSILSYLRRSFSDGDTHYEARMLYGRACLLYGDVKRGKAEFEALRSVYIENKDKPNYTVALPNNCPKRYEGSVVKREAGYAFIDSPELKFHTFFKASNIVNGVWSSIDRGVAVEFSLAFNYRGPIAIDIDILSAK